MINTIEGTGFGDNPAHSYEVVFNGNEITLYEDFYIHATGCSRKRKLGKIKEIKLLGLLNNNQFVLEVKYEEDIGDWEYY